MKKEKQPLQQEQKQPRPGTENEMQPQPETYPRQGPSSQKLEGKVAIITGGDSGIGKATALLFAKEGADVAIVYLNESEDAQDTKQIIERDFKKQCLLLAGDIKKEDFCKAIIDKTITRFGRLDILVNNAATQFEEKGLENISTDHLLETFETNIFAMFWITKYALPHLNKGAAIINSSSVTAYRGSPQLIDYAATKGAIVAFTRSLSSNLVEKGIRVNGVAPGPIWTPLIPATLNEQKVAEHGSAVPMKRAGQPAEVAPCYLFLASDDASYITGQFLHPNGGEIING